MLFLGVWNLMLTLLYFYSEDYVPFSRVTLKLTRN